AHGNRRGGYACETQGTPTRAHRSFHRQEKWSDHKDTGDGMLVEFASAVDAAAGALEVQRRMARRNIDIAPDPPIRFRVGINIGDVIVDGSDIFGDGVNIAARLQQLAEPGGIAISQAVREQIANKVDARFEDAGEQYAKNISRPVHVYRVALELPDVQSA